MPEFSIEKVINAPRKAVWEKLSDFGNVHIFHPMVEKSVLTGDKECGLGAKRTCTFYDGKGHADEEVTGYVDGKSMTVDMLGGSMPVKWARIRFDLAENGPSKTHLKLSASFEMKYGLLGAIMGPLMMKPMMKKMLGDVLKGLETHIATGKYVGMGGKLEEARVR